MLAFQTRRVVRLLEVVEYEQEEVLAGTILGLGDRMRPGAGMDRARGIEPDTYIVADRNRMAERSGTQQPMPRLWNDGRAVYIAKRWATDSLFPSQTRTDLCGSRAREATRVANSPLPAL